MLCKYSYLQATVNRDIIFIKFVYICNFQFRLENIKFQTINQSGYTTIQYFKTHEMWRRWKNIYDMANRMVKRIAAATLSDLEKSAKVMNVMISHVEKCTVKCL